MRFRIGLDVGSDTVKAVLIEEEGEAVELPILEVKGRPLERTLDLLRLIRARGVSSALVGVTGGAGASGLSGLLGVAHTEETSALAYAFTRIDPEVRTVIEMGRESQKYVLLRPAAESGRLLVEECSFGHKCAAGTGSFLDHMHRRLDYASLDEFAATGLATENPASLSGRCGVFAESDVVHLYQKGTSRERIVAGIHQAICRTYRTSVVNGAPLVGKVAFVGGVSRNPAARKYLAEELSLDGQLVVPPFNVTAAALGAALAAEDVLDLDSVIPALQDQIARPFRYTPTPPLRLETSTVRPIEREERIPRSVALAGLGVDIGSVSTKAALVAEVDGQVVVLATHYRRTAGDPLAAVTDTLAQIHRQVRERGVEIGRIVAGTTGSGRYLTADFIGADVVKNEITAQAHGTMAFAPEVDTIFEIGGQDSKYVRLSGPVIVDFEMNKACAAGTGAFLEKQAANLGLRIEDFGECALQGDAPPELDWQCTIFSESAMLYYQQNNVSVENLAAAVCLAAARNYLNKNVGARSIGEVVAFQGAVAFNRAMVAAMETILGRAIVVPPYPHLTGAAGVAWLAVREAPEGARFVGFDRVAEARYEVSSFECKHCANRCDVNTFRIEGGPTFFYNDRCERYSARGKSKKGEHLPDLFAEHEAMLLDGWLDAEPDGRPRVAIPRGMLFSDYFPLWRAFFETLDFQVVVPPATTTDTVSRGVELSVSEPCFPVKVAHGQFAAAVDLGAEYLFYPAIHDTEQDNAVWHRSETCPYVQGATSVIPAAVGAPESTVLLTPHFRLSRGERHLRRILRQVGARLGKPRRLVDRAVEEGLEALRRFREAVERRGREVLESLGGEDLAFVVIGRPYSLHDAAVNMHIGQRIRDLGVLPIPQDFLPLKDVDPSGRWVNTYSRQIQKKLAAAELVRRDKRLRAVVLTYFGCGPDSFANAFLADELGEPAYVMQIDEHTADAGVITRLEAFADTAKASKKCEGAPDINTRMATLRRVRGADKRVWVPDMPGGSDVLAAALRAWGVKAEVLPASPDAGLNLARKAISEDVCLPALITTEDILWRAEQSDFDASAEAFLQGYAEGPCRYGMYAPLQRRVLDRRGLGHCDVLTLGLGTAEGDPGVGFILGAYIAFLTNDLLTRMLHHTRPYEVTPGASDHLYMAYRTEALSDTLPKFREYLRVRANRITTLFGLGLGPWEDLMRRASAAFSSVERRADPRPLVGLVGEFYVRLNARANQDVIRKLEAAGAEVWLAPLTEFMHYANYMTGWLAEDALRDGITWPRLAQALFRRALGLVTVSGDAHLGRAVAGCIGEFEEPPIQATMRDGAEYIHRYFGGEAICSMGKAVDYAKRGLDGIVSVSPFNCMPGMTVAALSKELRRRHGGIPFLVLDYDGFADGRRDAKIRNFVSLLVDARAVGSPDAVDLGAGAG